MLDGVEAEVAAFHCESEILERLLDSGAQKIQHQAKCELNVRGDEGYCFQSNTKPVSGCFNYSNDFSSAIVCFLY